MDGVTGAESSEAVFLGLLEQRPIEVDKCLRLIDAHVPQDKPMAEEWTLLLVQELADNADFSGLFQAVVGRSSQLGPALAGQGIHNLLKKAARDRLSLAFLDSAALAEGSLDNALRRLGRLLALKPGKLVLDPSWGVGTIKGIDDFYKRVTIDFVGKLGHAMSFTAVAQSLEAAPADHLLTMRHNDPAGFARMVSDAPGELVKSALRSFGEMSAVKLENTLSKYGVITSVNWKGFWDAARKALKQDPLVALPAKRGDPIRLLAEAETYGAAWFEGLAATRSSAKIIEAIEELETAGKLETLSAAQRGIIDQRLAFGLKGAHNSDAAMYARLAVLAAHLGASPAAMAEMRAHLLELDRYLGAVDSLGMRDVTSMTEFLLADDAKATAQILEDLPRMPFNLLNAVLATLKESAAAGEALAQLLGQTQVPPVAVYWVFRNRDKYTWKLPPLEQLLKLAIAIIEARFSGEALRIQNGFKQMFEQSDWLRQVFGELDARQKEFFFERVQASNAWEPVAHRDLIGRMIRLEPALAERKRASAPQETPRLTSWRTLAERKALLKRMVEVDMPHTNQQIAEARSYGDLRENFEYQTAKDHQRQLMQRYQDLQSEFNQVRGTDFSSVSSDTIAAGTTVTLRLPDGSARTHTILGEWDSDEALEIISCKTRLALSLIGKAPGETALIPSPTGDTPAVIESVSPLNAAIRAWINDVPVDSV